MPPPDPTNASTPQEVTFEGEQLTFEGEPITFRNGDPLTFADGSPLRFAAEQADDLSDIAEAEARGKTVLYSRISGGPLRSAIDGRLLTSRISDGAGALAVDALTSKLAALGVQLDRVEALVGDILHVEDDMKAAGIGHNNPPGDLDAASYPTREEMLEISNSINDVRAELSKGDPRVADVAVLLHAKDRFEWLAHKLEWVCGKLLAGAVTAVGGLVAKAIYENPAAIELLHAAASNVNDWISVLSG